MSTFKRSSRQFLLACFAVVPVVAYSQVVLVDDFESYAEDSSIHQQGAWEAQANTSITIDSEHSRVVTRDGDRALQLGNRDEVHPGDVFQTVYTTMALPSALQTGTIYLRWMKSSEGFDEAGDPVAPVRGDMVLATNGRPAGFDPDGDGFLTDLGPGTAGQEAANYGQQAALVGLYATAAGNQFHARDNGSYKDVNTPFAGNLVFDQWYEMWMQVDHTANQRTRYYIAEDGESPQVVMNGASEFWGHRDDSYSAATAIKFLTGGSSSGVNSESLVYVDTVGVDPTGFSTNSLADGGGGFDPADFDESGSVDATDLALWQAAYGSTDVGDADGDSDSDGADFLVWQQNFTGVPTVGGVTAIPEPSSFMLIAIYGASCVFMRNRCSKQESFVKASR